jgi:hypothetical protein
MGRRLVIDREKWEERMLRCTTREEQFRWIGDSPGGAAVRLGVSRQYVHKLLNMREGGLDQVRVVSKEGKLQSIFVTEESMRRFLRTKGLPIHRSGKARVRG